MTMKQTANLLLGDTFLRSKYKQPLLSNAIGNEQVPMAMTHSNKGSVGNIVFYVVCAEVL
jgi:hypothetical protein